MMFRISSSIFRTKNMSCFDSGQNLLIKLEPFWASLKETVRGGRSSLWEKAWLEEPPKKLFITCLWNKLSKNLQTHTRNTKLKPGPLRDTIWQRPINPCWDCVLPIVSQRSNSTTKEPFPKLLKRVWNQNGPCPSSNWAPQMKRTIPSLNSMSGITTQIHQMIFWDLFWSLSEAFVKKALELTRSPLIWDRRKILKLCQNEALRFLERLPSDSKSQNSITDQQFCVLC